MIHIHHGDCLEVMRRLADEGVQVDAVVTDPPYHLTSVSRNGSARQNDPETPFGRTRLGGDRGFMGKTWDGGDIANRRETWELAYALLKPGGHLVAFGGTRTAHRMVCAIEDAGFEIRDSLCWLYAVGFPKSLDVSKAIDKAAGAEREVLAEGRPVKRMIPGADQDATGSWVKDNGRVFVPTETAPATDAARQWEGWGTALKPAHEPICLARKPLAEPTVAAQVLATGTGALNIDGCRVEAGEKPSPCKGTGWAAQDKKNAEQGYRPTAYYADQNGVDYEPHAAGRWPANVAWSVPEDEYELRGDVTREQKQEVLRWLYENA